MDNETDFASEIAARQAIENERTKTLLNKIYESNANEAMKFEFNNIDYSLEKNENNFILKFNNKHITFDKNGEGQEFFVSNNRNQKRNVIRQLRIYEHTAINDTLSNYLTQK